MDLTVPARGSRAFSAIGVALLVGVIAVGCGGHTTASTGSTPIINISERDFAITAPTTVQAGEVILRVTNKGPVGHELIVVRAPNADLPMRSDGLTVNEERLQHSELGALEPHDAQVTRDLDVHLTPGRYVLFCNMSGHYIGGMHHVLVVK